MKQYAVKTRFIFGGTFIVNADSKLEAKEYVEKHCGLVLGGNVHTSLSEEEIPDWEFNVHPEKVVFGVRRLKNEPDKQKGKNLSSAERRFSINVRPQNAGCNVSYYR